MPSARHADAAASYARPLHVYDAYAAAATRRMPLI